VQRVENLARKPLPPTISIHHSGINSNVRRSHRTIPNKVRLECAIPYFRETDFIVINNAAVQEMRDLANFSLPLVAEVAGPFLSPFMVFYEQWKEMVGGCSILWLKFNRYKTSS